MARPNKGPQLVLLKKRGCKRATYYIRWSKDGRSRERSTGESQLEFAQEVFGKFLLEQGKARRTGPSGPAETMIADVLTVYAQERGTHAAAPERIGYAIDALLSWWSDSTVDAIRPETCRRYGRERGVAAGTIRRELGCLRAAVNHAVKEGRLTTAPFVALPQKPAGKDRWLTRSEAARLLRAAKSEQSVRLYLPLFILLGLHTGARKGAILSLKWTQIDLVLDRINFNELGRIQTKKKRPIIRIPKRLKWFLLQAHARASCQHVIALDGRNLGDIKKGFAAACQRAGLNGVTPHTLRHTAGTWMAQAGVDLWQIVGQLGHSYETTTELYAHHHPDYLQDAAEALA